MGLTLTRVANWCEETKKLEYTPVNQIILENILDLIYGYSDRNPLGGNILFEQPLTWTSKIPYDDLKTYNKLPKDDENEGEGESEQFDVKDEHDEVILSVKKVNEFSEVQCRNLAAVQLVLIKAKSRKTGELRTCLEENSDPVAMMLGQRYSYTEGDDGGFYKFAEDLLKEEGDFEKFHQERVVLKMAMEFHNLDIRLLRETHSKMAENSKLSAQAVEAEFHLMTEFVGHDDSYPLRGIEPVPCYTLIHSNGCRAPPHRQLHGEIAYFVVKPKDTDDFCVSASTKGWFINKGYDKDRSEVDFDRKTDLYKSLTVLVRDKSLRFNDCMQASRKTQQDPAAVEDIQEAQESDKEQEEAPKRQDSTLDESQRKETRAERKSTFDPTIPWKTLGTGEIDSRKKSARDTRLELRDSDESASETESDEEEDTPDRRHESNADLPSEYWQIGKFVRYLKGGNQTSTIISLCALRDFQLNTEVCQLAIRDVGGLEVLLNLLETEENRCKIGALKILKEISQNTHIRKAIADLGGLQTLVEILRDPSKDLKCLAAETISNVAKFRRARRVVRQHGGIKKLVALLDCPALNGPMTPEIERDIEVARCGSLALWSLSNSTKNKLAMKRAGVIPLLGKLLKSRFENMLIPVVGTLQECASERSYRIAIRTEGMIEDLVKNLKSSNHELQKHCASTIFKCAEEEQTRDLVRRYDGLDPLVALLSRTENKELLSAATGAIWKCSMTQKNIKRFQELNVIDKLVALLNNQPEEVLVNVVGALGEMAAEPANRHAIRKAGGVAPLVQLLTGTNQALLVNTTRAIGRCAEEPENMAMIDKMDGVRLLWSLLKNPNSEVQASAAHAICPCIDNVKEAGEMVRSFVGGLELIVYLLKSDNIKVLAAVCAAIASIAKDEENLAVLTDHGVVPLLAGLTNTTDEGLKRHLSEAIARCCAWGNNRIEFGKAGAVQYLVSYLKSKDELVHRSTARALYEMSKHPENCIAMHEYGVVKLLLGMVGSLDESLQTAASGCIANIRRLAMANEKSRQTHKSKQKSQKQNK